MGVGKKERKNRTRKGKQMIAVKQMHNNLFYSHLIAVNNFVVFCPFVESFWRTSLEKKTWHTHGCIIYFDRGATKTAENASCGHCNNTNRKVE